MTAPRRYTPPPVDRDRTSYAEELERIRAWVTDAWRQVDAGGRDGDPGMLALDLVEAVLIDRLARDPEDARRALAFCFLVAVRSVVEEAAGDAGTS